jgi:glycosyltransferase involved in cell wall biosynthesis
MRILHVYSGNLFGGVERMLISLAGLRGSDFQHAFALCFEGRLATALRKADAQLSILPAARIARPLSVLRTRAALKRQMRAGNFDAVICHGIWSYCVFGPAIAQAGRRPVLFLHDAPEPKNIFYRWAWLNPPELCIANSRYVADLAAAMKPRVAVAVVHPLVPVPSAVDLERVRELKAGFAVRLQEVVILQASRLDPWKGHRKLLMALHSLRHLTGWVCWIAGAPQRPQEEDYLRELSARVDALGLTGRVQFIGHRDDMETVLGACDIYCQANETPEPFGMVFIEALFAGKPVVGSASGGTLEIVSPDCGILCGASGDELSHALARLIENAPLRTAMSACGPEHAGTVCGASRFTSSLRDALRSA